MKIFLLVFLLAAFLVFRIYNKLIKGRELVKEGFSGIDVQLKRRHDLIPKLVEAVKQYAAYESATLSAVTELRSGMSRQAAVADISASERGLSAELKKLVAVAEAYPELQANASFLDLQRNLTEVEQHIQLARRFYNGSVRNLNIRVDSFPDSLLARAFGFEAAEFFDDEEIAS